MHNQKNYRPDRRRALASIAGIPFLGGFGTKAAAQADFPQKLIKIICPFPPGSPVDISGRYMADRLQIALGNTVLENISGAGGATGSAAFVRAPADGYTLLTQHTSGLITTPFLYRTAHYDALKDLVPIWGIQSAGTVFVVNANSPYKTLKDFISAARAQPGKLSFGSPGVGSPPHFNAEMFMRQTGVKLNHVLYRGSGQIITDLLGGHVDSMFSSIPTSTGLINDGKLRGLSVLRVERFPEIADVPTLAEAGVSGWVPPTGAFGLYALAGTPVAIVDRLASSLRQAHDKDKEGQARLAKMGLRGQLTGVELSSALRGEYELLKKLIDELGIQPLA